MTTDVIVMPWNSKPTENHRDAHLHDCLWEMALEQAVLKRMSNGDDFGTALKKVTPQDHMKELDIICQDNGFRKFGSNGPGRDPNLVFDGEKIKVRQDPTVLMKSAPGVDTTKIGDAYSKAVKSDTGSGADVRKKQGLDTWLRDNVPGFDKLSETERISLIEAYGRSADRTKLGLLTGSSDYRALDEATRIRLLTLYGGEKQSQSTAKIDELLTKPGETAQKKLWLIGTEGFAVLTPEQQTRLLERYDKDKHFAAALDKIVRQENFTDKDGTKQAHALDILYRYAGRKERGYGGREAGDRTAVLVGLYDRTLSKPEFKLEENGGTGKPETADQSDKIESFISNEIGDFVSDN